MFALRIPRGPATLKVGFLFDLGLFSLTPDTSTRSMPWTFLSVTVGTFVFLVILVQGLVSMSKMGLHPLQCRGNTGGRSPDAGYMGSGKLLVSFSMLCHRSMDNQPVPQTRG